MKSLLTYASELLRVRGISVPSVFMEENSINHIWKYRKRKKIGQKKMAYFLGHSTCTQFSRWERGKKLPNLQNALKIAYALETPIEILFGDLYGNIGRELEKKQKLLS